MKYFKNKKIIYFVLIAALYLSTGTASAHVLKVNSTVGAVLHVDPNDSPVAGERSSIFFDLKDNAGTFSIETCTCTLVIEKKDGSAENGGNIIPVYEKKLTSLVAVPYTFPERALYTISLIGTPNTDAKFEAFKLSYDIRVDAVSENTDAAVTAESEGFFKRHILHIVLFGGAIVFAIIVMVRDSMRRKVQ